MTGLDSKQAQFRQEAVLGADERALLRRLLKDPSEYPAELRTWIQEFLAVNPPQFIPSEITGLIQIAVSPMAAVTASQTRAATAWGDLATTGPALGSMRSGRYLFLYGFYGKTSSATYFAAAGLGVNGSDPEITKAAITKNADPHSVSSMTIETLSLPNNTVSLKYKTEDAAATGTFNHRYLIAIRVGNA